MSCYIIYLNLGSVKFSAIHKRKFEPARDPRGVPWYFHTYEGSGHFLGFKILNFNIFGGFRKMNILGVWRFYGCFWGGITKLDYVYGYLYAL